MKTTKYLLITIFITGISAGTTLSQSKYLPKTYINNATNYAIANFASNATMFGISSALGVDTLGKSASWIYWFYKPGVSDTGYAVTIIVVVGFPIATGIRTTNLPGSVLRPLGNAFCESNLSITAAENGGGRAFRLEHPNTIIIGNIYKIPGTPDTSKPYWTFIYTDSSTNQFRIYNIDGITCTLITLGITPISNEIPGEYKLEQNYPNPFNPVTKIRFAITSNLKAGVKGETSNAKLIIFDLLGREVATLVNEQLKPGTYEVEWDGSKFSSGIYFYTLQAESFIYTKKMLIVK